ncbi:hypothetical protein HELRODRAFT_194721 [Helobdella robusta]|uniref:ABC transporter domain-containing protein n=1 Tax=Helobdella robusta TaxID=6412 RepID=T1FWC5_HELRO|nr:hypothetical protein HELRODRAFT_194721 [Helobdella robusta]ESN90020.1 hypothetical protein HELRODRAFT_194721 [Helobdella robusta]
MMMRLAARQYILICWKNLNLLKRHYFLVPFQALVPVGIIIILFSLRQKQDVRQYKPTHFNPFPIKHQDIFFPGSQIDRKWILTAVPRHGLVLTILKNLYSRMSDVLTGPSNKLNISKICTSPPKDFMFENETTMLETYLQNDTMRNMSFATIVFSGIPNNTNKDTIVNVTYKIRFPAEQHWKYADKSNWLTDRWYDDTTYNEPRTSNFDRGNINKPGYYREAFLTLQKYIDDAIIALILKQNGTYVESDNPDSSIQLRMFPYPYSTYDDYVTVIKVYMPLFIVICFIANATLIARDITLEKEKKLKESMKLMGLKPWVNWLAWFTQFFLFMLVSVALMTMFFHIPTSRKGSISSIFTYSHFSVTFVFLLLYAVSIIMFCFMVSSIFYKANVAAATTGIIYLLSYVPYFFLQIHYNSLGYGWKIFLSFFNNLAMSFSCLQFSKLESSGIGLHWWNLGDAELSGDDLTMQTLMIMLVADILLYSILTWYLDALFPGEFGVPQPFYFPFTYWYWCGHDIADYLDDVIAVPADYDHVSNVFEKPEKSRRVGVRIRNLTKKFMNSAKPAVNNLNIDLYEGYITAFLGHNGAGKTTTIFGTIFINGFDVSKHLDKVRRSLGLCPQHNILFDTLTVQQHLYFFANLKGCPGDEIQAEVEKMIESLHMENKRYTPSNALSGGMKRKLSIAIALIAGSKFVMLDEPTSGMDPESRRQTWDMLQQQQHGRTIILSTHFMDEADLLGDRIAIMSEGETQMCVAKFITELISEHIEGAKFEGEKGSELTYLLPKVESKKISKLFKAGSASMLTIGLSSNDSTLQKPTKEQIPNNSDRSRSSNNSSSTIIKPNNTINTNNNSSSSSQKLYTAAEYIEEQDDYDVIYERNKTLGMMSRDLLSPEPYAIVLRDVTKWYGRFLAVDGLSIAIERGECFGLLGVNGAGKTTTFKMMTGGLQCSSGDIYIKGLNIRQHPKEAQSLIGYCPQFDALIDQMTVSETLELFGKLRGIRGQELKAIVDDLIDTLVLRKHASKQAGTLSGGNKRKLGVGIALIGNPPIVFLDEPTTGMDPVARKKLWNVLAAVRQHGTTIVLTSHSMEECEALCTRIAIMVNGRFKCLGSGQHLKSKFGGGYTVVIKLKPNKKQEVLEYYTRCLMLFIDKVFPENILKDRHESLLHYQIDKPNLTWARVFEVLEKAREPFQIEDYSVGQTTLEQLFINFAKSQRVIYRDN